MLFRSVRSYYDAHAADFQVPEQVKLEYVALSLDKIAGQVQVTPEEVKAYYEQNLRQYAGGEERQASHILIAVDSGASAKDKDAARAKAEAIAKQVKANPASFADVARKQSQDPGSAAKGGDLGYFRRGIMPGAVDAVVFQMKPGDIAGPVESQYRSEEHTSELQSH